MSSLPDGFVEAIPDDSDLDDVANIEAEEFASPWRRDYFAQELAEPQRFCRVLRQPAERRTVAYLFTTFILDEMHVNKLAVRRDLWGRGLAAVLFGRALTFADQRRIALLTLEVRQDNRQAIEFYERWGFRRIYVRKMYYPDGMDAVIMHLERGALSDLPALC